MNCKGITKQGNSCSKQGKYNGYCYIHKDDNAYENKIKSIRKEVRTLHKNILKMGGMNNIQPCAEAAELKL